MSALSLPSNPVNTAAKPSSQNSSNTQAETDTPFASVLQNKVQSSKEGKTEASTKQATQGDSKAETASAESTPTSAPETAGSTTAQSLANGDYAQSALQQLLPWLQSLQGQNTQAEAGADAKTEGEALLPQADTSLIPLTAAIQTQAAQTSAQEVGDKKAQAALAGTDVAKNTAETAKGTANLAAPTEALLPTEQHKPLHGSFDAALQNAGEQINTQAQQAHTHVRDTASEPNRLQAPLGSAQWQNELGDRVQLMSRNNEGRAELVLTPPQLGRIEISLDINGDQAKAMFVSANPEVRNALEGALDRLREVLAGNGISLGQAQVGAESAGQQAGSEMGRSRQGGQIAASGNSEASPVAAWTHQSNNMLDVFA